MNRFNRLATFVVLAASTAACSEALDPVSPDTAPTVARATTRAEGEPPSTSLSFHVTGFTREMTEMEGLVDFGKYGLSRVSIQTTSVRDVGDGRATLEQLWTIHPPDPGKPVEVKLTGSLYHPPDPGLSRDGRRSEPETISRGELYLVGSSKTLGDFTVTAEIAGDDLLGTIDIVSFNPQPEPPAVWGF